MSSNADELIRSLAHANPENRKRAIIMMGQSKSREFLPHLARAVQSDSDPEVREFARKAGAYITKHTTTARTPASNTPVEKRSPKPKRSVNAPLADQLFKQAVSAFIKRDRENAAQYLMQAVQANPELATDKNAISLGVSITGLSSNEVEQKFLDAQQLEVVVPVVDQAARFNKPEEVRDVMIFFDVIVYAFVNAIVMMVFYVILLTVFRETLFASGSEAITNRGLWGGLVPIGAVDAANLLILEAAGYFLFISVIYGLLAVFSLGLSHWILFSVAKTMAGGTGSFKLQFHRLNVPYTLFSPIAVLWIFAGTSLFLMPAPLVTGGTIVFIIAVILSTIWESQILSSVHNIPKSRGLVAIIVARVFELVIGYGIGLMLLAFTG